MGTPEPRGLTIERVREERPSLEKRQTRTYKKRATKKEPPRTPTTTDRARAALDALDALISDLEQQLSRLKDARRIIQQD
jgi:hypothetical protein